MKKPIVTFLIVFTLISGTVSSAGNALLGSLSESGSEAILVSSALETDVQPTSSKPTPKSAALLLIATGLIGLAGVSRRNN
jgi:hypothetical protein